MTCGSAPRRASFEAPDGARARLAALVASLRRPEAYPIEPSRIDAIETHMSWVFLTDAHAYKLKKPIRTPHLDHTTPRRRRLACEQEVELNRRLAPDVYLGVTAVTATPGGGVRVGGEGPAVDWLVRMRRLPHDCMLDAHIAKGDVDPMRLLELGRVLARFYASLAPEEESGDHYRARLCDDLEDKRASLASVHYRLPSDRVDRLASAQQRWIAAHTALLDERAQRVVEAHGDLRPEHVCLDPDPVIIDCLEFDRELRLLDPASELAFLTLECERLGAPEVGDWVIEGYTEVSDDHPPPDLERFYASVHALVRAAVAIWHLDDDAVDGEDAWRERALVYLELGERALSLR